MGRKISHEAEQLAAEGQAQALKHAKDSVDRSAWLLVMLRKELREKPELGRLRRLELHCALSDLEHRQACLSAAYKKMVAMPSLRETGVLKTFILAYDEFLSALGEVRMDFRNDGFLSSKQAVSQLGSTPAQLAGSDDN